MVSARPVRGWAPPFLRTLVVVGAMLQAAVCQAQIVLDGTLGAKGPLKGPTFVIGSDVGQIRGSNLFHSFSQFNVQKGEIAKFTGPSSIANIVSRVTGGQRSFIDGRIDSRSAMPHANFFLLNPSGVLFGANASLDVGGSFHVSTANYLRFADGAKFVANLSQESVLTAASPAAFGFLGPVPGVSVTGGTLQVPAGKSLSVVGGDVQISNATLRAPGGRIQVASVSSKGEVTLSGPQQVLDLNPGSFTLLGQIEFSKATIDVSGNSGGTVLIRGGRLMMDNSSLRTITAGNVNGAPLGVDLQVAEDVVLANRAVILSATAAGGSAGDVRISAGKFTVKGTSTIFTQVGDGVRRVTGQGGSVTVVARDAAVISGQGSGLFSDIRPNSTGRGGQITISNTPSLTLDAGGTIATRALTQTVSAHPGGAITVDVGSLTVKGGASINSRTLAPQGGNVTVKASDLAVISGQGSGVFSGSSGAGGAGKISIDVGKLALTGGGTIQSGSIQDKQGGDVTVKARDSIVISGGSRLSSQAFARDANPMVISASSLVMDGGAVEGSTIGTGRAANISVNVDTLTLEGGAQIANSNAASSSGAGGNLTVTATGPVLISGRSNDGKPVSPFSNDASSGLFSTASKFGTGPAGEITVTAPTLTLRDGGKISVATESLAAAGKAGDISLNVGNLTLASGARIDSSTSGAGRGGTETITAAGSVNISSGGGLFSNAGASGAGGNIDIRAGRVELTDSGTISAKSTGTTGDAGSISITAGDVSLRNSVMTTEAKQADGGNISIIGGSLVHLVKSQITTSVESGKGKGGNITIDPEFVVLDRSKIRADAFGGPGGNVKIVADVFLTNDSVVSASSALGVPGTINIQASITNVSGSLARLPGAVLQAASLLRAACATRLAEGKSSSLVLGGRDGLPLEPGGLLPSPLFAVEPAAAEPSSTEGYQRGALPGFSQTLLDSTCSR